MSTLCMSTHDMSCQGKVCIYIFFVLYPRDLPCSGSACLNCVMCICCRIFCCLDNRRSMWVLL